MKRAICMGLLLLLLAGLLVTPALAVEAPLPITAEETETETEADVDTPEPAGGEQDAEEIVQEEDGGEDAQETEETGEAVESVPGDPSTDDPQYWVTNHADPYASPFSLTASGNTHANFTTRALNDETLYIGIDVSEFQGTIDWAAVAAGGIQFVIIRAAYRGVSTGVINTDSKFETNIAGALAAGLEVGVYIYSQAITEAEAREEADYLIKLVSGYNITLPLVLDFEYYSNSSGYAGRLYNASLSRQAATDICNAFCDEVESAGYDSMVYGNPYMLNGKLYADQLGRIWLANFTTETSYSGDYEYWQCSSSGAVSGISTLVDLDFWFKPNSSSSSSSSSGTETSGPFTDVGEDDWFYIAVMEAYNNGVVKGMTDTAFYPYNTATRGQVVTMIYRMMGEPDTSGATSFTDLTQDYYIDAVAWAADKGVVQGVGTTTFAPDNSITRQDLVTMLYRLAGSPSVSGDLSGYSDGGDVQSYAQSAMVWAVEKGIIQGYGDNTLLPANYASRAEVCAILMRYLAL